MKRIELLILAVLMLFSACDDMHDFPSQGEKPVVSEATHLYVLCEGLFNMNNSTLASYNLKTHDWQNDIFRAVNQRGLGDTANDMLVHGDKLFIVVNVSSQLEILESQTGRVIKQIPLFNENGIARQPRNICIFQAKAYITCFDGYVIRIDMERLEIDGICKVGRNPEGLCVANNKIYVANSGGLDFPNYDNTISVIEIETFAEIKKIEVAKNPGEVHADSQGNIYLCSRGDYSLTPYVLQKIDSQEDKLIKTFDNIPALKFKIYNDLAFIYNYDFNSQESWIKVFDCRSDEIVKEQFVVDGTEFDTPYAIDINPYNGDVYIADGYNYVVWGDVLCFTQDGNLKYRLNEIGLNPNKITFLNLE